MSSELEGAPVLDAVAAGLRRDGSDLALYGGFLLNTLTEALPPDLVSIERHRSAADRLHGREGDVTGVQVDLGDRRFRLVRSGVGVRPSATVGHQSGGITLNTETVGLDEWAERLAAALVERAGADAAAAAAAARLAIPRGSDL